MPSNKLLKNSSKKKIPEVVEAETMIAMMAYPTRALQAEALGIVPRALNLRIAKYNLIEKLKERQNEILEHTMAKKIASAPKAVDKQVELMDKSKDDRIQLDASKEILKNIFPSTGNTLVQNNIKIVTDKKENYDL